jgi:flavodoxin
MKILVTHAGMAGPATGVAERVAKVLAGLGEEVTLLPMSAVSGVKGYAAVVAGCLVQGGGWVPEAMEFVRRNQAALNRKPFAIFTVIPSLATDKGAESRMVIMQYTAYVRGMVHTISEGFFSGESEKKDNPEPGERSKFKLRLLLGLLREPESRSQTETETWTAGLHEKLIRALA